MHVALLRNVPEYELIGIKPVGGLFTGFIDQESD
jgi:hypothetical protein